MVNGCIVSGPLLSFSFSLRFIRAGTLRANRVTVHREESKSGPTRKLRHRRRRSVRMPMKGKPDYFSLPCRSCLVSLRILTCLSLFLASSFSRVDRSEITAFFVFVHFVFRREMLKWMKFWVQRESTDGWRFLLAEISQPRDDLVRCWHGNVLGKIRGKRRDSQGGSEDLLEDRLERYKSWNLKLERTELRRVAPWVK